MPNYGAYRFTRVAGPTPDAPDVYSPLQEGWVSPGTFRTASCRSGRRSPQRRAAPTPRPRPTASRSAPSLRANDPGAAGARPRVRDPVGRPDVPRAGMRPRLVRRRAARTSSSCSACSRRTRPRESLAFLLGEAQPAVQAGAHQRAVRLCRRRLRRPRPHAVPALRGARGDVLARPAGAARARPLPAVPGRHQAARLQDAHADRRRSRDRQDHRLRRRPRARRRRPRQLFGQRRDRRRHRRDRHLRHSEGRRHHRRGPFARRDRRLDARLRHAADDDGAGSAGRRGGGGACRSIRSSSAGATRSRPAAAR